jgi:hypothetical protein
MDGAAQVTQTVANGGSIATSSGRAIGHLFYHSHDHADRQQALTLWRDDHRPGSGAR